MANHLMKLCFKKLPYLKHLKIFGCDAYPLKLQGNFDKFENEDIILAVYIDDIVIMSKELKRVEELKQHIKKRFKAKDLGKLTFILGLNVEQQNGVLIINQKSYINKLIERFNLQTSKVTFLYSRITI